ncbi:MAG: hypothetical protein GEU95_06540 [Rhizobiales bacterium]|nr:hypothetical protein [Hyphomicrobiales bacterium]
MSPRFNSFLEGTLIAVFALLSVFAIARIGLEPRNPSGAVGVVFAPWVDARAAFIRAVEAGGRFVRYGGPSFIVVVQPDGPDYARKVKDAGALLLVDPQVLAACFPWTTKQDRT